MTSDTALPVELDASDLRWIMQDDLAPTDNEIQAAAMKWCGDKDRETFASDAYYFRQNWKALDGLKAYVAREVASRVSLAEQRLRALSATRTETPTHRHKKRGSEYVLIGMGRVQAENWREHSLDDTWPTTVDMREIAIYRDVKDGSLWARPREEFEDGRFEELISEADGNKPS